MERVLDLPVDLSIGNPVLNDGFPSHLFSDALALRSTLFEVNAENSIMNGFPMISTMQEDSVKDFHRHQASLGTNELLINTPLVPGGGISMDHDLPGSSLTLRDRQLHDLFLRGTPIASDSGRNNVSDSGFLHQVLPVETLEAFVSSSSSNALSSSVAPSLNCEYDGLLGDINDRWNLSKFLNQPEFSWKSGFHPVQYGETDEWMSSNIANVCPSHPPTTSNVDNELSLSLATCEPSIIHGMNAQDQCSDTTSGSSRELSLSFGSSSSAAQFSQILCGSRYLNVAQGILSEMTTFSLENVEQTSCTSSGLIGPGANLSLSSKYPPNQWISFSGLDEFLNTDLSSEAPTESSSQTRDAGVKSQLLSLLQMVDDRYTQCLDELHTVASAFHAATELNPQMHSRFALHTVSFMYKNLRERISREILKMGMHVDDGSLSRKERSFEKSFIQKQWALQQLKRKDQQLWRPQRGLPERSVSVLRAWMFQNFLHPYPKDAEKHLLAIRSGLTRSQVSNWFINARVRLWKPLIEEMYAELNRKKGRQNDEGAADSNFGAQVSICNQRLGLS